MRKDLRRAGLVPLTLGALGCGDPRSAAPLDAQELFRRDAVEMDSQSGEDWRSYLDAQKLHQAWAPGPSSPWRPFYKPTLVAAVAAVQSAARPLRGPDLPPAESEAISFCNSFDLTDAAVFVDLTGEQSVAWASALRKRGLVPVLTINNWPHQFGLLRLERPLGALLYFAPEVAAAPLPPEARPVFILERSRLGQKGSVPAADRFDNRFFHVPTDFPSALQFRQQAIRRIIYINPRGTAAGSEEDDLNEYFCELGAAGLELTYVTPQDGAFIAAFAAPGPRWTIFSPVALTDYASDPSTPGTYFHSYPHYSSWHSSYWTRSSGAWGGSGAFRGSGFSS